MYRIAVSNRKLCGDGFLGRISRIAGGGYYDAILLREKDLAEGDYEALAKEVIRICGRTGKRLILHGFPDTALRLSHPFLHLPLPVWEGIGQAEKRRLRAGMKLIGTSVHSEEQLMLAAALGADYVTAGHIFATDCKKGVPPRGLGFLEDICAESPVPVYAIGGISELNEASAAAAGAAGVCLMSASMRGRV